MSYFVATGKASVLRVPDLGQVEQELYRDLEFIFGRHDRASDKQGTVRFVFRPGVDIKDKDILVDQLTGNRYVVGNVLAPSHSGVLGTTLDVRVDAVYDAGWE